MSDNNFPNQDIPQMNPQQPVQPEQVPVYQPPVQPQVQQPVQQEQVPVYQPPVQPQVQQPVQQEQVPVYQPPVQQQVQQPVQQQQASAYQQPVQQQAQGNYAQPQQGYAQPYAPQQPPQKKKSKKGLFIGLGVGAAVLIILIVLFIILFSDKPAPHASVIEDSTYQNEYYNVQFELPEDFSFYTYEETGNFFDVNTYAKEGIPYFEYDNGTEYYDLVAESKDHNARILATYIFEEVTAEDYLDNYVYNTTNADSASSFYTVKLCGTEFLACDCSSTNNTGDEVQETIYISEFEDSLYMIDFVCFEGAKYPPYAYDYYFTQIGGDTETALNPDSSYIGTFDDTTYTNEHFNIQYTLPEKWGFYTYDNLLSYNDGAQLDSNGIPYKEFSDSVRYYDSLSRVSADGNYMDNWIITDIDTKNSDTVDETINKWQAEAKNNSSYTYVSEVYKTRIAGHEALTYTRSYITDNTNKPYTSMIILVVDEEGNYVYITINSKDDTNISVNELKQLFTPVQ